jgi:hypothetical protein
MKDRFEKYASLIFFSAGGSILAGLALMFLPIIRDAYYSTQPMRGVQRMHHSREMYDSVSSDSMEMMIIRFVIGAIPGFIITFITFKKLFSRVK